MVAVTDASEINVVNNTLLRKGIIAVITLRVFLLVLHVYYILGVFTLLFGLN